ncbi:MAG: 6-carboxytetrahydropterin synthase [Pirellulaceae bacterium]
MLRATVTGAVDPETGYLINIQIVDRAIAQFVAEQIATLESLGLSYLDIAIRSPVLSKYLPSPVRLVKMELVTSPFLSFLVEESMPMSVQVTQEFEFSAAHRLHCDSMSEEENRDCFGKCNNPAGHGHNYRVAVTLEHANKAEAEFSMRTFEQTVKEYVIEPLDHKHLNVDVIEFATLNPSVENIAMVIWKWVKTSPLGTQLKNIRVYETPKTWADYRE